MAAATHGATNRYAVPATVSTSRISCVAYVTEDSASLAKMGSAIRFDSAVLGQPLAADRAPDHQPLGDPRQQRHAPSVRSARPGASGWPGRFGAVRSRYLPGVHIVVMGCGRVGSSLARNLERAGHSVAIIDQNPAAFRRLGPEFAGDQVTGVGFVRETLHRAGIDRAGAFAAVSSGDNSNIISARVARETFGVAHVVARIYDPKRAEVYERLGIPTVATVPWTVNRLLSVLLGDKHVEDWRDPSGAVSLVQVPLHEGWIGQKVRRAGGGDRRPGGVPHPVRPRHAADRLDHAAGRRPGAPAGHRRHRGRRRADRRQRAADGGALMRVAIAGAGGVGRSIARELIDNGHDVMLIERDPDKVDPGRVPQAEWLQADAAELASLEEARLQDCDVVDLGHRRRQGQPGRLAAGQDRVRGPPGGRPDQPPGQRVAVHRGLGRRRRGVHPAGAGRAGRGGGLGRRPGPADDVPAGSGEPGRDHPAEGRPGGRAGGRGHAAAAGLGADRDRARHRGW